MATLGSRVNNVMFKLGNRTDLALPIGGSTVGVVTGVSLGAPGVLYTPGDILNLVQAGGVDGTIEVTAVDDLGNGSITGFALYTGGSGFSNAAGIPTTGGTGAGATFNIIVSTITNTSRILGWLRDAYVNLAMSIPFSELEETISFLTQQGQPVYDYPPTVRAIKALTLYRPDGTVITIETKDIKFIRKMNSITPSAPSIWCDFAQQIIFRPVPDGNGPYTCLLDTWLLPVVTSDISSTEILLPMDWWEALDYAAAVRGHTELQEEDKARAVQSLLYGSTDPQSGKYTPGMIQNLQTRQQATTPYVDWGVQPKGQTQPFTGRR